MGRRRCRNAIVHMFSSSRTREREKRKSDGRKILQFFSIALVIMYEKGAEWTLLFSSHFSRKFQRESWNVEKKMRENCQMHENSKRPNNAGIDAETRYSCEMKL